MLKFTSLVLALFASNLFCGCRGSVDRSDFGKPPNAEQPPQQVPINEFVAELNFSQLGSNLQKQSQNLLTFDQSNSGDTTTVKYKFNSGLSTTFVLLGINYFDKDSSNLRIEKILLSDATNEFPITLKVEKNMHPFTDYQLIIKLQNSTGPIKEHGMNVVAWKNNVENSSPSLELICDESKTIRIDLSFTFYNLQILKNKATYLDHNTYCGVPVSGEKGQMSRGIDLNPLDQNTNQIGFIESYLQGKTYGARVEYFPKSKSVLVSCYEDNSNNIVNSTQFNSCYPAIKNFGDTYKP